MTSFKKFIPFLVVAIVFAVGGFFTAQGIQKKDQNASVVQAERVAMESWFCKANPKDPKCNPTTVANSEGLVAMESWFCKANPKDWRCNPTALTFTWNEATKNCKLSVAGADGKSTPLGALDKSVTQSTCQSMATVKVTTPSTSAAKTY